MLRTTALRITFEAERLVSKWMLQLYRLEAIPFDTTDLVPWLGGVAFSALWHTVIWNRSRCSSCISINILCWLQTWIEMLLEFQVGIVYAVILVGCLLAVKGTCEFVSLTKDPFGICRAGCFWLSQWHDCVLVYEAGGYPKGLCFLSDKKSCTVLVGCHRCGISPKIYSWWLKCMQFRMFLTWFLISPP